MKISDNISNKNFAKANSKNSLPSFGAKKTLTNLANLKNWKLASLAYTALGLATININQTHKDEPFDLEKLLLEQKNNWKFLEPEPAHTKEDIQQILELYKKHPELVYTLVNMQTTDDYGDYPRFGAKGIKQIIEAYEANSDLTMQLIGIATKEDGFIKSYTFRAEDIFKIVELSSQNPELIEKAINTSKEYSDKTVIPRYTKVFEYTSLLKANLDNPLVVNDFLEVDNILAREIEDFAHTFNPKFYKDLKSTLPENFFSDVKNIRKYLNTTKKFLEPVYKLEISDKEKLYNLFTKELSDEIIQVYRNNFPDFELKMNQFRISTGYYKENISTPINKQNLFVGNILANNNTQAENILKNFDFSQYKKNGLPLKYSRKDFILNINNLLKELNPIEQELVMQNFGIMQGLNDLDGLLNNKEFKNSNVSDKAIEIASKIKTEIELFTLNNEVQTGNKDVDTVLSGLIQGLPEFTFIVGKQQHSTHAYSTDIHTLKVLQGVMNNPYYNKLSDNGKTVLKMSVLFHDIAKKGNIVDSKHALLSGAYAEAILEKFPFSKELKNRILNIIYNHHWFKDYNTKRVEAHDIAALCRHHEDLMIYEMFAKSDFENINDRFHLQNSNNVKNKKEFDEFIKKSMIPIYKAFTKMRSQSNFVFDTRFFFNGEKFPRTKVFIDKKPVELKVLDFNKLQKNEDLFKYGFNKGVTKENAHFLVHMTRLAKLNETYTLAKNQANQVSWSTSLVKEGFSTTSDKLGFIFNAEQANISIAYKNNLSLGYHRTFEDFKNILFLEENDKYGYKYNNLKEPREFIKNKFLECLAQRGINLSKQEYILLSEEIISKKFTTQITKDIQIGDKLIKATDLQGALEDSRNALFEPERHNEIDCYNPVIKGLFAKVDSIEECPEEFLRFAAKYDLPIILMS